MWRVVFAVLACACGRIGFDATSGGDGGGEGIISTCEGPTIATLPPASGGGFALVRAYGDSPNAPPGTPQTPTVDLTWESRGGGAAYAVIRAECGESLDVNASIACTPTTRGSCRAGVGTVRRVIDTAAPASPSRVRYQVIVVDAALTPIPQLDDGKFMVDVAIPPPNMVLVHRASVNREMCDLIGTQTDPTNHHRCTFTGPGATPFRAHPEGPDLSFANGFYDFGYDLFVDRWESACNWTHAADGGKCGAGGTTGDCFGDAPVEGVTGNVFFSTFHGRCYVKLANGWADTHSLLDTNPVAAGAAYAIDPGPGHDRPPLAYLDIEDAAAMCHQIAVPNYGAKRPWRLRELVAAGAFERLPLDPTPIDPSAIQQIEAGMAHGTTRACNVATHNGVTPGGFRSGDELARGITVSGDPSEAPERFVIGSVATSRCISRYGIQDLIGNVNEAVSDTFGPCGTGTACVGVVSLVDAGNRDLVGFALDGQTGVGPVVTQQPLDAASKVLVPLAMPLVAGAPFGRAPDAAQLRGDRFDLYFAGAVRLRMGIAGGNRGSGASAGRFWTDFGGDPFGGNIDVDWGMRCVVAAIPR